MNKFKRYMKTKEGKTKLSILVAIVAIPLVALILLFGTNALVASPDLDFYDSKTKYSQETIMSKVQRFKDGVFTVEAEEEGTTEASTENNGTNGGQPYQSGGVLSFPTTTSGGGKLVTTNGGVPFYDGLTVSTQSTGCQAFTIKFRGNGAIGDSSGKEYSQAGKCVCSSMTWTALTSTTTNQYKVVNHSTARSSSGIRFVDNRVCFALAPWIWNVDSNDIWDYNSHNAKIGRYFDVVLTDNTVIPGILGDSKGVTNPLDSVWIQGQKYQCSSNMRSVAEGVNGFAGIYCHGDKSILEMIKDSGAQDSWTAAVFKNSTVGIDSIVVYTYNIIDNGPLGGG